MLYRFEWLTIILFFNDDESKKKKVFTLEHTKYTQDVLSRSVEKHSKNFNAFPR